MTAGRRPPIRRHPARLPRPAARPPGFDGPPEGVNAMGTHAPAPPGRGRHHRLRRLAARIGLPIVLLAVFSGSTMAFHWSTDGWYDRHFNYPIRPNGQAQIEATFGKPCSKDANFNRFTWTAEGVVWKVNFHKKLGGAPTIGWYDGNGGGSTNLYHDVRGHIADAHLTVLGGIGAYACRENVNSPGRWSVHAWGAAIDIAWNHQLNGNCVNVAIDPAVAQHFMFHNWYWLECDRMHFQYATGF
jgi:hypothetical protein